MLCGGYVIEFEWIVFLFILILGDFICVWRFVKFEWRYVGEVVVDVWQ